MYNFFKERTLSDDPKRAHAIPHEANQYVLMNDVLYHLFTKHLRKKIKETDIIQQLAVPTSLRNDILLSYHDSLAAGCHMGVQKTYEAVRQKYFCPGMYQHIYDYITSCKTCQIIKRNIHVKEQQCIPYQFKMFLQDGTWTFCQDYQKLKTDINISFY